MKKRNSKLIMISIISLLVIFTQNCFAQVMYEHIDDNTVSGGGKKMHVCSRGLMSGIHVYKNDYLCLGDQGHLNYSGQYIPIDDYNTGRLDMHACPPGMAMVGIHVNDNVLKCSRPTSGALINEYVSFPGDARYGMHACPFNWVMTGIHVKKNLLLCSYYFRAYM